MCGCRRTSLACTCAATSPSEPAPRSSSSRERKCTWKRTSPSSSSSLASSPECAAAASSYASSTVCGTIERSSCSRSHGHSSRRRRVRASRRRSASTISSDGSLTAARLVALLRRGLPRRRGGGGRRRRGLRTLLALLDHVALAAVRLLLPALPVVLREGLERLLLALGLQRLPDGLLGLLERLLRRRGDLGDLEEVLAELRLDRSGQRALLGLEDRLVELLLEGALGLRGQLAALRLRGLVDRVLLRHGLPALTVLQRLLRGLRL